MAGAIPRLWVVLAAWLCACAARPQGEVKLITEPRPGEEFVLFQSGLANHTSRLEPHTKTVDEFSTSHKIPLRKAALDKQFETMDFEKAHRIPVHEDFSKRSAEEPTALPRQHYVHAQGTAEVVDEVRTEYSVVTSRPRKVSGGDGQPAVNVEPRGDTGLLDAKPDGADEKKALLKKLSGSDKAEALLLRQLAAEHVSRDDQGELLTSVEVKPISQVGVTKPHFEVKTGDISVPEMKQEAVITSTPPPAKVEVTTTYVPLTSARPQDKANFEVIPVNVIKTNTKEYVVGKSLDFVDSPLDDKLLVPAGSSANSQSRIEVKKGPNGEDYEYEYVYYYYDDADNDTLSESSEKAAGASADRSNAIPKPAPTTTTTTTSTTTTTTTTTTTSEKPTNNKRYLPTGNLVRKDADSQEDHVGSSEKVRGRGRNKNSAVDPPHGEEAAATSKGRGRYTTIERHRGEVTTTIIPEAVNEVIPARVGSRFRNRQLSPPPEEVEPVVEERLPANTRFPPRSRGTSAAASTTPPPERSRAATGSVRRPSLELVDSSSFRTHSSGASPDQDFTAQTGYSRSYTPSVDADAETRPSRPGRTRGQPTVAPSTLADEEDYASVETEAPVRSRGPHIRRPTSTTTPEAPLVPVEEEVVVDMQTTRAPQVTPTATAEEEAVAGESGVGETGVVTSTTEDSALTAAMMDKAALELYAVLQQAQAENASNLIEDDAAEVATDREEAATEEILATTTPTTPPPTTTVATTTTTTTTTTPAPTTTTTTTTEAPTTPTIGRGRHRLRGGNGGSQNGGSSRNRFRSSPTSTTTTESAATESSTRAKGRFGGHRTTSSGFGGRRKPVKHEESHEVESSEGKQESTPSTAKPSFSRGRFGAARPSRGGATTSTTEHSTSDASSSASNAAVATKPVFPERHTPRRRPGLRPSFTTATPTSEETRSDGEETNEPSTSESSPASTASTLRPAPGSRPRISLNPGGGARPLRPGPRINIGGRARPGAITSTTPPTTAPEAAAADGGGSAEQAAAAPTPEDAAPETSEEAVTTPAPDALTRLRNRPRLRVTERAPKTTPAPVSGRRNLVSSLLPRRRPQAPAPEPAKEAAEPAEEQGEAAEESESIEKEETAPPPAAEAAPASEPPQEGGRLSSLLAGRRRANLPRRPGTLFPSSAGRAAPSSKEAA